MADTSAHLMVRQASRATFRALVAERSLIVRSRAGEKRIGRGVGVLLVRPGQLAVTPPGECLTVENLPPPGGGPDVASALLLGPDGLPT